jgi:hypothetical protein
MFKYLYKHFATHHSKLPTNFKPGRYFSTKIAAETKPLQDWEYVQKISTEIKNSDVNEALKYLIQVLS